MTKDKPPSFRKLETDVLKIVAQAKRERQMNNKLLTAIKTIDWRDVAIRAFWTFLQAFLAVFIIAGEDIINSISTGDWHHAWALIIATAIAALAAGLSAVKTIAVSIVRQLRTAV